MKKLALLVGVVFALLLFGCLGSTGTQAATATPGAAATVSVATATPSATPIGQIQQTATPTTIAAGFNLEAVKAKVEASAGKLFPAIAPVSLDQYADSYFGNYYKKETPVREGAYTVTYSFTVRRSTASELKHSAEYPSTTTVNGETVYYELVNEGTPAQISRGDVACVAEGVNKGFVFFSISGKVMTKADVENVFKELMTDC